MATIFPQHPPTLGSLLIRMYSNTFTSQSNSATIMLSLPDKEYLIDRRQGWRLYAFPTNHEPIVSIYHSSKKNKCLHTAIKVGDRIVCPNCHLHVNKKILSSALLIDPNYSDKIYRGMNFNDVSSYTVTGTYTNTSRPPSTYPTGLTSTTPTWKITQTTTTI